MIEKLYQTYLRHPLIQTDTRKLVAGEIFFALKGPNFNGNSFAAQALKTGAVAVVVDEDPGIQDEGVFLVPDALKTLQDLALYHRKHLPIPFLAITGSNGKTTTKELIHAVLSAKYKVSTTVGNLNNHIGVPLTILAVSPGYRYRCHRNGCKSPERDRKLLLLYTPYARAHHKLRKGTPGRFWRYRRREKR